MDDAFFALESRAAFEVARAAAALNDRAGDVCKTDIKLLRSFIEVLFIVNRRARYLYRTAVIHAERPLSYVEVMRSPVGHLAARVIPEEAEKIVHTVLVVRAQRCRAQPHIVIEFRRWLAVRHAGRLAFLLPVDTRKANFDGFDFSDAAGENVFAGLEEL